MVPRLKDVLQKKMILQAFFSKAGKPCLTCGSMKLTKDKFLISEFSNHRRVARVPGPGRVDTISQVSMFTRAGDMDFGPKKLVLGTLEDINSRRDECPFCRLVIYSVLDQFSAKLEDGQEAPDLEQNPKIWDEREAVCSASWQIDGRVLVRDKEGKVTGSRAATRRILLHWEKPAASPSAGPLPFIDTYVVLMASQTRENPGLFLGRPSSTARIDAAAIRKWIELCGEHHGPDCALQPSDFSPWSSFFGVIDVEEMMLTSLPKGAKYVTLSYVWGRNQNVFRTIKDNIRNLLRPGGVRKQREQLPRTIRDAIDLCTALGERYLWVDALCIIQNSERSWTLNSRVMDLVYGNSYLNICAADGIDAHAGLKGFNQDLGPPSQIIEPYSKDVRLMCTRPAESYIQQSTWNTRGWTFQERLLSPRNLIFVGGRIFFQCRTTARCSDIITEHPDAGWSLEFLESPSMFLKQLPDRPLDVYKKALELYMLRELSRPKDILAAFNGIGNVVCAASGGTLVYGLPSSHFDWALLWEAKDAPARRLDMDDERFPSWSWCGWEGEKMEYKPHILVGCENNLHEWISYHTWITWYIRDGNGNLKLVWDGREQVDARRINLRWRGYALPEDNEQTKCCHHDKYGRVIKAEELKLPRDKASDFQLTLDECPYGVNIIDPPKPETSDARFWNNPVKDMPYLQFFTWSAFFRLQEDPQKDFKSKSQRYSILDYKDDWCGTIVLDRLRIAPLDLEKVYEFIAISDAKEFHQDEYDGWAYYISKERELSAWDLYYVLMVENSGQNENIWYRVGLGKIFKEAFNNSCGPEGKKQWKEFILG